jgi:hypothetical protein
MLLKLLATLALGLGTAGLVLAVDFLIGRKLPRWLLPASAGIAMMGFMIYMEYSWLERTRSSLPDGVVVTSASSESMWYRPWTYLRPLSLRLIAVDTRRSRRHADAPGRVVTSILLMGRWLPTRSIPVVFDCDGRRRADLDDSVELTDDGRIIGADWRALQPGDPALAAACQQATVTISIRTPNRIDGAGQA